MGKKRRLIKKSNKFARKYSSHPRYKFLHLEEKTEETINKELTVEVNKVHKTEKPQEIKKTKTNIKVEPVVKVESKTTANTKAKVERKIKKTTIKNKTSKSNTRKTNTQRVKKTKPTTDKAI
tara:strand:- start:1564 stop:1929 length:366 start_codon:yes stop_codon:yes gene_type:complete